VVTFMFLKQGNSKDLFLAPCLSRKTLSMDHFNNPENSSYCGFVLSHLHSHRGYNNSI